MKLVGRGDTTVVDAYLSPILRRYVDQVGGELGADAFGRTRAHCMFMMSSGGLTAADCSRARTPSCPARPAAWSAWSRPAAHRRLRQGHRLRHGRHLDRRRHYDGDFERAFDTEVAGVRMRAPMMRIHTVAAGGGSILHLMGPLPRRPGLAGANPGPACYRRGGPLTVTDANVMLGKLNPILPRDLRPGQDQPLDATPCARSSPRLAEIGDGKTPEDVAEGFIASPSRTWPTPSRRSRCSAAMTSPATALNCFGGAGGQHACLVADALGMKIDPDPPLLRLLSAYGMGLADIRASRQQALDQAAGRRAARTEEIAASTCSARACSKNSGPGHRRATPSARGSHPAALRYDGTDTTFPSTSISISTGCPGRIRGRAQGAVRLCLARTIIIEAVSVEGGRRRPDDHRIDPKHARSDAEARSTDGRDPPGLCRRQMARRAACPPRPAQPGMTGEGPGADHRAATRPSCRARLAGGHLRPRPCGADPRHRSRRAGAIGTRPTR
jgi:5-oxoprolinase (ATP-hydrolysing)